MLQYILESVIIGSSLLSAGKSNVSDILIFCTLIIVLFWILKDRNKIHLSTSVIFFILGGLLIYTTLTFSSVSILTSQQTARAWLLIVLFASSTGLIFYKRSDFKSLISSLVFFSAGLSVVSLLINFANLSYPASDINLLSPSYGHIRYAEFFLPLFPVSVYLFFQTSTSRLLKVAACVSVLYMFFTFSRATWLSMIIVPVIFPIFIKTKSGQSLLKVFLVIALLTIILLTSMYRMWSSTEYRKSNPVRILDIINKPLNVEPRIEYYKYAFLKTIKSPFFGYGPGTFYYPKTNYFKGTSSTIYTHNHILQKLYEFGVPGGLIYIGLLFSLFLISYKNTRNDELGRVLILGVVVSFMQAQMDFGWEIPIVYFLNLLIMFHYQQPEDKTRTVSSKIYISLLLVLVIWTIVSGLSQKSTSEKFNKLVNNELKSNYLSSPIVKQWMSLDKGNGKVYVSLSGKEFIAGNYKESLALVFKSVNSPMYPDIISTKYLIRFLAEPAVSQLDDRSIFKILDYISTISSPHDFFWIKPEEDKKIVFETINKLLKNKNIKQLGNVDLAKIYYWKFTGSVSEIKYIKKALELDPNNKDYKKIDEISQMALDPSSLDDALSRTKTVLTPPLQGNVYVSLLDLIYSKIADKLEKEGDLTKEIEVRSERLSSTHYRQSYVTYISRLVKIGRQEEAEKILSECKTRYVNCEN